MKKLLIALALCGFTAMSAEAQTTTKTTTVKKTTCKTEAYGKNYKVCKKNGKYYTCGTRPATTTCDNITAAPKLKNPVWTTPATTSTPTATTDAALVGNSANSQYAKNYQVCKGTGKYHICKPGEEPTTGGMTTTTANQGPAMRSTTVTPSGVVATTSTQTAMEQPAVAPQQQSIPYEDNSDVTLAPYTVTGRKDTGINNANAPYHGKNSPQYDGVEKNKARNLNIPPDAPNATFYGK